MSARALLRARVRRRPELTVRLAGAMRGPLALFERDLLLLRRSVPALLLRSVFQPLLFVFVFAYVYPRIGVSLTRPGSHLNISTVVLPGLTGFALMFCGVYAVGMPLAVDLGVTREIDDRALAPIPTIAIPGVTLLSGAAQAIGAALLVPLMIHFVAIQHPDTVGWSPALAVLALIASGFCMAAMGLFVAGLVPIALLPVVLTVLPMPVTFLGAGYYSWASLSVLPALKIAILLNPMTWVSESLRGALTPAVPHMTPAIALLGTSVWAVAMATIGSRAIARRVMSEGAAA